MTFPFPCVKVLTDKVTKAEGEASGDMEIRQFTYISMVAECGSFTKAAAKLFITQPALSNYINKLEEELGVRLFDRTVTPVKLTYAGEQYLEYAKNGLILVEGLQRKMRDISQNQSGRLRLGFPSERIVYMLPLLLPAFQKKYPRVQIETMNGPGDRLTEALISGDVDFVFMPMWNPRKGIGQYKVSDEELLLVAAKGYLKDEDLLDKEKRIFNWKSISRLPFITLEKGHVLRHCVDTLLKGTGTTANTFLASHSNMLSCRLAAQGIGVAVVPEITVSMLKDTDNLECYHLAEYPVTWEIDALYREDIYLGSLEKDLLNIVRETLTAHKKNLLPLL